MRFRKQLIAFLSVLVLGGATLGAALAAPSSQSTEGDGSEAPASESETAPEIDSLKETWSSFAQLLQDTASPVDEERLLNQVRRRVARRRWIGRSSLAAAILIGVGIAGRLLAPATGPLEPPSPVAKWPTIRPVMTCVRATPMKLPKLTMVMPRPTM